MGLSQSVMEAGGEGRCRKADKEGRVKERSMKDKRGATGCTVVLLSAQKEAGLECREI